MSDSDLHKKLDSLLTGPLLQRKVNFEQSEDCPIWNPFFEQWEESDAQFRERIKTFMSKSEES